MKKLIIILLFNLAANSTILAQHTILDSVAIYHSNYILDSIYMRVRTKILNTERIAYSNSALDAHSTTPFGIVFSDCTTNTYRVVDTMYAFTNTVWSQRVLIQTAWDTSVTCQYPANTTSTTHYIWFLGSGMATSLAEVNFLNSPIELFPNPASSMVNMQYFAATAEIQRVLLYQGQGKLVQELESQSRRINVSELPNGLYFVRFELASGEVVTKKLVVQKD